MRCGSKVQVGDCPNIGRSIEIYPIWIPYKVTWIISKDSLSLNNKVLWHKQDPHRPLLNGILLRFIML